MKKLVALLLLLALASSPALAQSTNPADYTGFVTPEAFGYEEGPAVDDSFFDDAVFIGDSISVKLSYYALAQRKSGASCLGQASFLTSTSLGCANALWRVSDKSVHPTYQGEKTLVEDAVAMLGARKAFIMLGMNDVAIYGTDETIENMFTLIERIRDKSPGIEIYIQSVTPRIYGMTTTPTNRQLFEYNLALVDFCREHEYTFIDVAYAVRDSQGYLVNSFCSDKGSMGMHFTDDGCVVWVDYLVKHTGVYPEGWTGEEEGVAPAPVG